MTTVAKLYRCNPKEHKDNIYQAFSFETKLIDCIVDTVDIPVLELVAAVATTVEDMVVVLEMSMDTMEEEATVVVKAVIAC